MNLSPVPAGLGLLSAASWGSSDFVGGLGSRRTPALVITAAGQIVSLLLLVVFAFALHAGIPSRHDLILTIIGGVQGALALALFYRALAIGAMGLTAALTGLLTALVPVAFSALHYGLPSKVTIAGLAAGCIAIWLITHQKSPSASARALLYGTIAGVGFGAQLVLLKLVSASSTVSLLIVLRVSGVAALLLLLLASRPAIQSNSFWLTGSIAGVFDTVGNVFYLGATRLGRLDAAAVICSLYPAGTILLAAIVLRERPSLRQLTGMALALVAVALLSL